MSQPNPNASSTPFAPADGLSPLPMPGVNLNIDRTASGSPLPPSRDPVTGYSATTEEILKRISANASSVAGTPHYEDARKRVLESMKTSASIPTPPMPTSKRGRPRGGARGSVGTPTGESTPASSTPVSTRGRGGGRGRGRGGRGGRGGKRKRSESDDSDPDDSDVSNSYTPLPARTKSGRNVTKPTAYVPTIPSPTSGNKRKRTSFRQPGARAVCKICQRGHSPSNNMIVFCDECNTGYHQYCHDPPIEDDVIAIPDKEWFCRPCTAVGNGTSVAPAVSEPAFEMPDLETLISGKELNLTDVEKRQILTSLSSSSLVDLLLHALTSVPTLPIFPPNSRTLLEQGPSPPSALEIPSVDAPRTAGAASTTPAPPPPATTNGNGADNGVYDDYEDTDPPTHYPKLGNGIARTMRPESEDLQWLVDENTEVFSHTINYGGMGAEGAVVGSGMDTS
ncbi:hypothetical protein K402DRAFT_393006 [Aulographum hederae CBS 113979]|uniref:PHD-type domain-containing protein n=1 Tax=Aulographum hederae CBS 113979 TaxID=1176131 RepID=A0A6G1H2A7_9PEZI|nr:hypothetical protein K402DRAFT_393006 [Aulographum hederae CBS 113979]